MTLIGRIRFSEVLAATVLAVLEEAGSGFIIGAAAGFPLTFLDLPCSLPTILLVGVGASVAAICRGEVNRRDGGNTVIVTVASAIAVVGYFPGFWLGLGIGAAMHQWWFG